MPDASETEAVILEDAPSNQLIVGGTESQLKLIEQIAGQLQTAQPEQARETRIYGLQTATATDLATTVRTLYKEQLKTRPAVRPEDQALILPDATANRLIVAGLTNELAVIEQIVNTLGQVTERAGRQMRVLTAKSIPVAELLVKLRQLYQAQVKAQPELAQPEALFLEDAPNNQLILAGNSKQLELIDKIVTQLELGRPEQPRRETRFIAVGQAAELQRLLPLVQQLYRDEWKDRQASDPADAQILSDPPNVRFIVTGKTNHLAAIEAIVAKLSRQASEQPRETRVYELQTATAPELATTVQSLYQEQLKTRPAVPDDQAVILPDAGANRLIVSGLSNELALVETIVKRLDQVTSQTGRTRAFILKHADAESVSTMLTSALVTINPYGRSVARVSVGADKRRNMLIISGEAQALLAAAAIVEQLDAAPESAGRQMRVVPIKSVRVSELVPKVKQIYQDQTTGAQDRSQPEALIMEDATSNQLVLAGTEKQLELIGQIVSQLQTNLVQLKDRQTRFISVGSAKEIERLLPVVEQLYKEQWKDRVASDPPDAQILPDPDNRRLIVTARPEHLDAIAAIVTQVARDRTKLPPSETRIYDLTMASASELIVTLKTLYQEQLKTRTVQPAEEAVLLPDAAANRVIACGSVSELEVIDELIKKLDQVTAQTAGTRVFKLKSSEAGQVASVLSTALVQIQPLRPQRAAGQCGSGYQQQHADRFGRAQRSPGRRRHH